MADEKYNGWTNYATWNMKLWMDNEESSYRFWVAEARQVWQDAEATEGFTREQNATYTLMKQMEQYYADENPLVTGVYADLLGWALQKVDWYSIAEAWLEDVQQDDS